MSIKISVTEQVASFFAPNGERILTLPVHQYTDEDLRPVSQALSKYKEEQVIKKLNKGEFNGCTN